MHVLEIEGLVKHFPAHGGLFASRRGTIKAVNGVSLTLDKGETLGIVGESGSGKSTLGLLSLGLIPKTAGKILFDGKAVSDLKGGSSPVFDEKPGSSFRTPSPLLTPG